MNYKKTVKELIGSQSGQLYRVVSWHNSIPAKGDAGFHGIAQVFYCIEALGDRTDKFDGWGEEGSEYDSIEDAVRAIDVIERGKWLDLLERKAGL